jgi:hypothetical protein
MGSTPCVSTACISSIREKISFSWPSVRLRLAVADFNAGKVGNAVDLF